MAGFKFVNKTKPKLYINIGAMLDIPTASITTGIKGETIYNGGLGSFTGVTGPGNSYKSVLLHYMSLSALNRVCATKRSYITTYDTEVNVSLDRLENLAREFKYLPQDPLRGDDPIWSVTDKANISANDWAVKIQEYVEEKNKDKDSKVTYEAFLDPYTKKPLVDNIPSFVEIDSLTEFEASSTMKMLSGDLDSSDTNTFAMKQGLFKAKFISTIPNLANASNTYFLSTAHVGETLDLATGPAKYNKPSKKLPYMNTADTIKGTSGKFQFLTTCLWRTIGVKVLKNQTTGLAEYPKDNNDQLETDLNIVRIQQERSKNGPSGYHVSVIVSQLEGVLPTLTEFHNIKEHNRFGLSGNNTHYHLDLYPNCNLSRTTVRSKIDQDDKLKRAINITSELLQLKIFQPNLEKQGLFCTPLELYEDIKKLGYDWDILLNTRGYWVIDQYSNKVPYLNTIDLLKMRKELYVPYFLNKDKTLKKEYIS